MADRMYVCVAENFPHRNKSSFSSVTVNIQAITCEWQINMYTFYVCITCPIGNLMS